MEVLLIYTTSAVCTTDTSIIGTCQQLHHHYYVQHTTYHYHSNHISGGSTTNTIASAATSSAISFCTTVMALPLPVHSLTLKSLQCLYHYHHCQSVSHKCHCSTSVTSLGTNVAVIFVNSEKGFITLPENLN
jgi:hypothetical protein